MMSTGLLQGMDSRVIYIGKKYETFIVNIFHIFR